MMLDTDFHWFHCSCRHSPDNIRYHPWFSLDFCDAMRIGSSVALPPFDFAFIGFIALVVIPQIQPFIFFIFCDTRISISSVTLLLLDCSSCIPQSGKVWRWESLVNWLFSSIWWKKVWRINRSANTLLIISTNLVWPNHGQFAKFTKLSCNMVLLCNSTRRF